MKKSSEIRRRVDVYHKPVCTILLGAMLSLSSCAVKPPPTDYGGKRITRLTIRYVGRPTVDDARLRNLMVSKAGTRYSESRIDEDVKALYRSGLVDDVRFTAEPDGEGVRLMAEVQTRPPLCCGSFVSGNTVFTDQKLAIVSKLKTDEPTAEQRESARRSIEKFYRRHGYKDVTVAITYPWKHDPYGTDHWVFSITEGAWAKPPEQGRWPMRIHRPR